MAENENKTTPEKTADKAPKKSDKPSFFQRAKAWLKTVRAECKKVTWANWESVKSNSIVVIVVTVVFAVFLGILDYAFSNAIVGLSRVL
ncbi:MAG: preprotein translocase subunit SecE [Clostridia bacterium]|jgi:preprotein translocase SecE subunit|nr:preprotein translocase subunit SecE [Clostridia bacterium]